MNARQTAGTRRFVSTVIALLGLACAGRAAMVAYDGLEEYTPGALAGLSGGSGFEAAFSAAVNATVFSKSLNYSNDQVTVQGGTNCVRITNPDTTVVFGRQVPTRSDDALYLSFLFQSPSAVGNDDFFSFGLNNANNETTAGVLHRLNTGISSTAHAFGIRYGAADLKLGIATATNQTYFVVFRLRKLVTGVSNPYNELALFVNPSTTNEPLPSLITTNSRWTAASYLTARVAMLEAGDAYYVDSLRIGTTYADVVLPVAALSQVAMPTIAPNGGLFTNSVAVTLSTATPGATLRYTVDGTTPSLGNGALYTEPFTLTRAARVRVRGFLTGRTDSPVTDADFYPSTDFVAGDDFESYAVGPLQGLAGGDSFLSPYASEAYATIVSRQMTYQSGAVRSEGGGRALRVADQNSSAAVLSREFYPQAGDTLYLSCLFEQSMPVLYPHNDDFISVGFRWATVDQPYVGFFNRANVGSTAFCFGIRHTATTDVRSSFTATSNTVYFVVVKLRKLTPGVAGRYEEISLFVNPTTLTEPATPTVSATAVQNSSYNLLTLRTYALETGDAYYLDNLRVGRTYASVLPPATGRGSLLILH